MSYALSHIGEAEAAAVEPVSSRTPPYTQLTRRYGSGPGWGAIGGFALSFLVLRHAAKQMSGSIT